MHTLFCKSLIGQLLTHSCVDLISKGLSSGQSASQRNLFIKVLFIDSFENSGHLL